MLPLPTTNSALKFPPIPSVCRPNSSKAVRILRRSSGRFANSRRPSGGYNKPYQRIKFSTCSLSHSAVQIITYLHQYDWDRIQILTLINIRSALQSTSFTMSSTHGIKYSIPGELLSNTLSIQYSTTEGSQNEQRFNTSSTRPTTSPVSSSTTFHPSKSHSRMSAIADRTQPSKVSSKQPFISYSHTQL